MKSAFTMKLKELFIILKGPSLKQIKQFLFRRWESDNFKEKQPSKKGFVIPWWGKKLVIKSISMFFLVLGK